MNDTHQQLMRAATQLTREGRLTEATQLIQRALNGAATAKDTQPKTTPHADLIVNPATGSVTLDASATVPGGSVFEVDTIANAATSTTIAEVRVETLSDEQLFSAGVGVSDEVTTTAFDRGAFTSGTHTHLSQTRRYKLYVPPGHSGRPLPLVVMLHGCTQDPDDFAAGTAMNEVAREQGFYVLYPAQSQAANPSRCWNWFKQTDQRRDRGEPALIASMTEAVVKAQGDDAHRVYIAGLSAGGAMATIVAEAYPEIFAAAGVHSGLARGAAKNVIEALAVMKSGDNTNRPQSTEDSCAQRYVPTIVFHGDQDRTVHPRNGEQVIAAVMSNAASDGDQAQSSTVGEAQIARGVSSRGRRYTRTIYRDAHGKALAEHWLVHGAGHAWSGGDALGSYTDATGPDATREMLRFFFEQSGDPAH